MSHRIQSLKDIITTFKDDCLNINAIVEKKSEYSSKTYGELQKEISSLGTALLHHKIGKGDVVGMCMNNRIEWPVIFFSTCSIGAIALPIDTLLTEQEFLQVVDDSDITTLFISAKESKKISLLLNNCKKKLTLIYLDDNNETAASKNGISYSTFLDKGKQLELDGSDSFSQIRVDPNDPACFVHMYGNTFTTLSHKGLIENAKGMIQIFSDDYFKQGEKWLAALPFHHIYPVVNSLLIPLLKSNTVVLYNTMRMSELISVVNEYDIQYMALVPLLLGHLHHELDQKKQVLPSIRFIIAGGASLHEKVIHGMGALGITVLQGYGLSENSPIVASNRPGNNKAGSVGQKLGIVEVMIENPDSSGNGELLVKGPCTMIGYYKNEVKTRAAFNESGWLRTGDIARIDDEGYIFITGRKKNVIVNRGGINIYPEILEAVLISSPYISDAVIVPRINDMQGEHPHAYIVPDYEVIFSQEQNRNVPEDKLYKILKKAAAEAVEAIAGHNKIKGIEIVEKNNIGLFKDKKTFMFNDYYLVSQQQNSVENECCEERKDLNNDIIEEIDLSRAIFRDITNIVSYYLRIPKDHIDSAVDLNDYGFDSISLTGCISAVNERYAINLEPSIIFECTTLKEISSYLFTHYKDLIMKALQKQPGIPPAYSELSDSGYSTGNDKSEDILLASTRDRTGAGFFMGVDAGSTTIKVAVLDNEGQIYHTSYTRTAVTTGKNINCTGNCERCGQCAKGNLIKHITFVLKEVNLSMNNISHIVVTGSQINTSTRKVLPYDAFVSEVTAHIAGALHYDGDCKAILDVGGQDSKSMKYDSNIGGWKSKMSGICAAGTGAFLDNVAAKLGITVESMEETADYNSPLDFSSVCAVFAATSINKFKSRYSLPELVGGACAAQARTIMSGVGELLKDYNGKILFQGGVAANKIVAHYLQKITGNEIVVPEHYQVMGAIGAALLAKKQKDILNKNRQRILEGLSEKDYKAVNLRSRISIKDFFSTKEKPLVWRNLFYPAEILNAMDCQVYTLETRAALAAQNRNDIKTYLDNATLKGYGAETCSFLRVLEGMELPVPVAGMSTTQPCQQGERILRDLLTTSGKGDAFYALQAPIDESPSKVAALARDIEESIHILEKNLGQKMDMGRLEEAFEYSNQAREVVIKCNDLRASSVPLIPGRIAVNFANLLSQGWGTKEFVDIQSQLYEDLLEKKDELEKKTDINSTHRLGWLHLAPYYSNELMDFIEIECNAPIVYEEANAVRWAPLNIRDPYMSLARKILDAGFMSMEKRISYIVDELQKSKANGCILYNHMFSRCSMADITVIRNLQVTLSAAGIPLLVLDGDCIDPTIDPCSTFTKVQAFTEVLNFQKYDNYFGIRIDDIDDGVKTKDLCHSC